jgi:hypothetical protein
MKLRMDIYANYVLVTQPLFVTGDPRFQVSHLMYVGFFRKELQRVNVNILRRWQERPHKNRQHFQRLL